MLDNRINANLSQTDQQAMPVAINTIRTKIPFLIDLTTEARRFLSGMGDRGRTFVIQS